MERRRAAARAGQQRGHRSLSPASGNLYFAAELPGGIGGDDLWVVRKAGDQHVPPENLGDAINTPGREVEPWIAPDESYLIISGLRRRQPRRLRPLPQRARRRPLDSARRLPELINSPAGESI